MLKAFAAQVQSTPNILACVIFQSRRLLCLLAALTCLSSICVAQSTTIRIRFVSGKTGKPTHLRNYFIRPDGNNYRGFTINKIDKNTLDVTFKDSKAFTFTNQSDNRCDAAPNDPPTTYSVQEIVDHGAISPNICGAAHDQPVKGELVIYTRHAKWRESLADWANLFLCV